MLKLIELGDDFESIDIELFRSLKLPDGSSLMSERERLIVHRICRLHRPLRVLEIGVAFGGGSAVLLNAISDMPDSKLISIDINPNEIIGHKVKELLSDNVQWQLYRGKDPVEILDELNENFDLLVIDSMHLHPVETLNFLAAFPFLSHRAIVIIHDISMHAKSFAHGNIAPQLLYSAIVADKLHIKRKTRYDFINIGILQINDDTVKYIYNLFHVLNLNWYCPPHNYLELKKFITRHYDLRCNQLFDMAIDYAIQNDLNPACLDFEIADYCKKAFHDFAINWQYTLFTNLIKSLKSYKYLIFYGGGEMCRYILDHISKGTDSKRYKPDEIWDINAADIKSINDIPVVFPNFDCLLTSNDYGVIITVKDAVISSEIEHNFSAVGFSNYIKINSLGTL